MMRISCFNKKIHFLYMIWSFTSRFVKIQDKLRKAVGSLDYFTQNEWVFSNKNLDDLLNKMTPEDRKVL